MPNADTNSVTHWLATRDPRYRTPSLASRGREYLSFAANIGTTAPGSAVAAVPSAAAISGPNGAQAASQANAALEAAGSDLDKLTKTLIANPILGATSVMDLALTHSGYNPLDPAQAGNFNAYIAYVTDLVRAPFFHLNYADQKSLHQQSSDWDKLIGDIVSLFEGIQSEDQTRIVAGLKQLAHSATSSSDTEEKLNVFSQQAISINTSQITVGIYYSSVSMIEHDGKHTTRQADYLVNRAFLTFYTETWPQFAPLVAKTKVSSANDWLNQMNSKK
jgi:hypothetical protein